VATLQRHLAPVSPAAAATATATTSPSVKARPPLRLGLLGYGAINAVVARGVLDGLGGAATVAAVLVQSERPTRPAELPPAALLTADPEAFFDVEWDVLIEGAGQPSVVAYAARCLAAGRDFLITSIGALTDDVLHEQLLDEATRSGSQLLLASGAMPAIDWMSGASLAGDPSATMTMVKPPRSWLGTPAEHEFDLGVLTERTVLFEGTARVAASKYPKNSNIAAMLAFGSRVGLDRTTVILVADPTDDDTVSIDVSFSSAAGSLDFTLRGVPSPENPRTGMDVPFDVLKAIQNRASPEHLGA
jgi:aspartate dehydrogenase